MAAVGAVAGTALSLHPSAAEPQAPLAPSFPPKPCLGRGSPKQEQRQQPRGEICCVLFTPQLQHSVSSKDAPGNKLSLLGCLCYTTFPAVHWLFNFSLECQTFCLLALNFLQLLAALIALCCQTEDCFPPCPD